MRRWVILGITALLVIVAATGDQPVAAKGRDLTVFPAEVGWGDPIYLDGFNWPGRQIEVVARFAPTRAELATVPLERVALNVMDYAEPDNRGDVLRGVACVAGGPAAYWSTLPLPAILEALSAEGIPAYVSNTAGTFLCNFTSYTALHALERAGRRLPAGFIHLPYLPSMVASRRQEAPSMDLPLMIRAAEVAAQTVDQDVDLYRRPEVHQPRLSCRVDYKCGVARHADRARARVIESGRAIDNQRDECGCPE